MLLTENRKGKIRMRLRKVLIFTHAVAEAHAENTARADRREGLHHLIARVPRIRPRIEPHLHALHAIGLQRPDRKCRQCDRNQDQHPAARRNEQDEGHKKRHTEHDARRPKVRLTIDEKRHEENRTERNGNTRPVAIHAEPLLCEHRRDRKRAHEHAHELGELRRLKAQGAKGDPPLRAVDRRPHKEHRHEQKEIDPQPDEHEPAQPLIIDSPAEPAGNRTEQEPLEMPLQKIIRILEVHCRQHIARTEHIDCSRHEENRHDDDDRLRLALKERIPRAHHTSPAGRCATSRPIFAPRALNFRSYSVMILSASPSA